MDIFGILSIAYLALTAVIIYFRPEIIIGVQLFATPIIGSALQSLGVGIGVVNVIFALTLFSLIVFVVRNRQTLRPPSTPPEFLFLLLVLWVGVTLLYTPSPNYGMTKFLYLIVISIPCVFVARFYCNDVNNIKQIFVAIGWYAMAILGFYASYVMSQATAETTRITSSFFGPLSMGYITITILPFIFAVFVSSGFYGRVVSSLAVASAVYVVIATGSRGPILALIAAVLLSLVRVKNFVRVFLGLAAASVAVYIYITIARETENQGLARILGETDAGYVSAEGRLTLYQDSIQQFFQYPLFGQGSGSFSYFMWYSDTRLYPHNAFLEVAGEFGLVGLTIFVSLIMICLLQIQYLRVLSVSVYKNNFWTIASIQALFFMGIINSCISFDLPLQRPLFVAVGLLAASAQWKINSVPNTPFVRNT